MSRSIVNLLLFKIGWVACVTSAALGKAWLGGLVVIAVAVIYVATANQRWKSAKLLIIAAILGLFWESALVVMNLVNYPESGQQASLAPYWIVAMWVLFATTLTIGFRWLQHRLALATLLGAIGGPMAFYAGSKAGAVALASPPLTLAVIGVGWAVLMPVIVWLSRHYDGHAPEVNAVLGAGNH